VTWVTTEDVWLFPNEPRMEVELYCPHCRSRTEPAAGAPRELEPGERLLELINLALDHGIDSVRASGGPLTPFLMTQGRGKPALRRFVTGSLERSREMAQEAAGQLPKRTTLYAMASDGYLSTGKGRVDAILVEAGERKQATGFLFAQRYRPQRGKRKFAVVGKPAIVKQVPNRLG
jgi:hypothetical protein